MKKTKIIASIGPASNTVEVMSKMVNVGMNVARINFSHATLEERLQVLDTVKKVRIETKKPIGILYDTKGPEFRSGMMENNEIELVEGANIRLVKDKVLGNNERFSVNHPQAIAALQKDDVVLLENGLMKIEVISKEEDGVTCRVINGGKLGNKKSLSAPGINLNIPFISDVDREDIIFACRHEGDFLALSFVNSKEDILQAKEILKQENREDLKIISKIESQTGIDNLDEIIELSDGIMVARGDLGVEVPMEHLPILQKMMIDKCRQENKFCIVATEMLESMKKSARPTRAEVSDVANAVLDGADCVMLSGETTTGKYPIEVVRFMADICINSENHYNYLKEVKLKNYDITKTIAKSVVECANTLDVKAIVVNSITGYSAKSISSLKPASFIIALCQDELTAYSLTLNWGVHPVVYKKSDDVEDLVENAKQLAKEFISLKEKDIIIATGGILTDDKQSTNFIKIVEM